MESHKSVVLQTVLSFVLRTRIGFWS